MLVVKCLVLSVLSLIGGIWLLCKLIKRGCYAAFQQGEGRKATGLQDCTTCETAQRSGCNQYQVRTRQTPEANQAQKSRCTMNTIERKLLRDKMVLQDQKSLAKLDYPGVKLCGKVSDKIS